MVGFSSEALASGGRDDEDGNDECSSTEGNTDSEDDELERRTARFTEYSMTSSVLPRSEGVCVVCRYIYMYVSLPGVYVLYTINILILFVYLFIYFCSPYSAG